MQLRRLTNILNHYPIYGRLVWFGAAFLILSGLIGSRIIGTSLLEDAKFWMYGGAGKALLFAVVVLAIMVSKQTQPLKFTPPEPLIQNSWVGLSAVCFSLLLIILDSLASGAYHPALILMAHVLLWLVVVSLGLAVFGWSNIKRMAGHYRSEIGLTTLITAVFYALFNLIYSLWAVLAAVVLGAIRWLLLIAGLRVQVSPPRTLVLDKFGVTIEQYCSGIESLALFLGLFMLIAVLDWQRFNHGRLAVAFSIGLIGLFLCNILRVFLLIMAGYYINPAIAFSLFHSYAGMVLFIIYFWLFWRFSYPRVLKTKD